MYRLFERAVAVLVLLFSMQAFVGQFYPEIRENGSVATNLRPGVLMAQALIYLLLLIVIAPRLTRVLRAMGKMRLLTMLFVVAALSILWSIDPMLTFRRVIPLWMWLIVGIYFGERYSIDEFLQLLGSAFAVVITVTFALYFAHPSYVFDPGHEMAWRGICLHKNTFGAYMAMSGLVFAVCARKRFPLVNYTFCAASALLVFLSHSATAWVLGGIILVAMPLLRLAKLPAIQFVPIGTVAILCLTQLVVWPPQVLLSLLGRDSSFTGRTDLWEAVMIAISRHPLLGYGYDAFWQGLKGESLQAAINAGWLAPHSHNGYLELALGLGIPGLALFVLIYISLVISAMRYLRRTTGATAIWPMAYVIFLAIHNTVESALLLRNELPCLLFVTIFASLKLEEYRNARKNQVFATNAALSGEHAAFQEVVA